MLINIMRCMILRTWYQGTTYTPVRTYLVPRMYVPVVYETVMLQYVRYNLPGIY